MDLLRRNLSWIVGGGERALPAVALAEVGGCSLVFEGYQDAVTKKQPPLSSSTPFPPSQEGSFFITPDYEAGRPYFLWT